MCSVSTSSELHTTLNPKLAPASSQNKIPWKWAELIPASKESTTVSTCTKIHQGLLSDTGLSHNSEGNYSPSSQRSLLHPPIEAPTQKLRLIQQMLTLRHFATLSKKRLYINLTPFPECFSFPLHQHTLTLLLGSLILFSYTQACFLIPKL